MRNSVTRDRDAIILTQKTNKWEELLRNNKCLTSAGKYVEEKGLPYNNWNKSLIHENYSIISSQIIVCVEAFN